MSVDQACCWGVIPAAGIGTRMASEVPKQYLPLSGATVLEHSLGALLDCALLEAGVVAVHPDDFGRGVSDLSFRQGKLMSLEEILMERIRDTGPLTIAEYMEQVLARAPNGMGLTQKDIDVFGGVMAWSFGTRLTEGQKASMKALGGD